MTYYFLVLLGFINLFLTCKLSLLPFKDHSQSVKKTNSVHDPTASTRNSKSEDDDRIEECLSDCYCSGCNITLVKPKKVINPYRQLVSSKVSPKPFGNFCVKCAACLVVATEIQNVIEDDTEECETDLELRRKVLKRNIEKLCNSGFKNFDLRMYENHEIFTNNFVCTAYIVSVNHENWTKRLRDICTLYISRTNLEAVVLNVLDSLGNLTDAFCRGSGVFRDCVNIKSHENITMPPCKSCLGC